MASEEQLRQLKEYRDQLNARIHQGRARLQAKAQKKAHGRLVT